jgi:hypothetical protein
MKIKIGRRLGAVHVLSREQPPLKPAQHIGMLAKGHVHLAPRSIRADRIAYARRVERIEHIHDARDQRRVLGQNAKKAFVEILFPALVLGGAMGPRPAAVIVHGATDEGLHDLVARHRQAVAGEIAL